MAWQVRMVCHGCAEELSYPVVTTGDLIHSMKPTMWQLTQLMRAHQAEKHGGLE